ncbi:glutamate receptor U1-like [Periplaneta americana]|uniref:glutamate receptor U1-like n=1 Tax=Periplaneta americana TaxID=6978 RepID=UPI0037E9738A
MNSGYSTVTLCVDELSVNRLSLPKRSLYIITEHDLHMQRFLEQVSITQGFSRPAWLVFLEEVKPEKFFEAVNIPFDSRLLAARWSRGSEDVSLVELHRALPSRALRRVPVASWSPDSGFVWTAAGLFQRTGDLNGAVIKAAVLPQPPFVNIIRLNGSQPVGLHGYIVDIWRELERRMNFTTQYYMPEDQAYGMRDANGSWNGMVDMVLKGEVDVATCMFSFHKDRMDAVYFFPPFWKSRVMVYIKEPGMEDSKLSHILLPFSSKLWLTITGIILTVGVLMCVAWSTGIRHGILDVFYPSYYLLESCFFAFYIFCQQGQDATSRSWSFRLVLLTAFVTAVILFASYSAIFTSFLTVRTHDLPFTDFRGFLSDGTYKLGIIEGSADKEYFMSAKDPILREIYSKLVAPEVGSFPRSSVEGLRMACTRTRYGVLLPDTAIKGLARHLDCNVVGVPQAYFSDAASIIISKTSPYRELFYYHLQAIKETGIVKRITEIVWPPKYEEITEEPPSSVTLQTVTVFFILLLSGIGMCVLIFVVEYLYITIKS